MIARLFVVFAFTSFSAFAADPSPPQAPEAKPGPQVPARKASPYARKSEAGKRLTPSLFPILSYVTGGWMMGWASAPYDPQWAQRYPRRAAWMSLAGPGANFALVILAALLIRAGMWMGVFDSPDAAGFTHVVDATRTGAAGGAATLLSIMFSLNLLLGIFNLLPVPPLDGGRITAIISPRVWLFGAPLMLAVLLYRPSPLLLLVAIIALPQLIKAWKYDPSAPENVACERRHQHGVRPPENAHSEKQR